MHNHKYVSRYKSLPNKAAGILKQNITHVGYRSVVLYVGTIDDKPMFMCVCLCVFYEILIAKNKILPFSNHNVRICNFL
jgi:hypothetical protein